MEHALHSKPPAQCFLVFLPQQSHECSAGPLHVGLIENAELQRRESLPEYKIQKWD